MVCMLVSKGVVDKKGNPSIEFYKAGYENRMTDEPYPECMECPRWALGDQCEKDFEEAKFNGLISKF